MDKKVRRSFKNQANPRWKGETASYYSIHQWLKRNHGSPRFCSSCEVLGRKEKDGRWSIQWALKKGCAHGHNVELYEGKCRSCHRKYDMTAQERLRLKNLANNQTLEQLRKLSEKRKVNALKARRNYAGKFA